MFILSTYQIENFFRIVLHRLALVLMYAYLSLCALKHLCTLKELASQTMYNLNGHIYEKTWIGNTFIQIHPPRSEYGNLVI